MKTETRERHQWNWQSLRKQEYALLTNRYDNYAKLSEKLKGTEKAWGLTIDELSTMRGERDGYRAAYYQLRISLLADLKSSIGYMEIAIKGGTHREKEFLAQRAINMLKEREKELTEDIGALLQKEDDGLPF